MKNNSCQGGEGACIKMAYEVNIKLFFYGLILL